MNGADIAFENNGTRALDAESSLFAHNIQAANDSYRKGTRTGELAAGLAITDILLLPYWSQTTILLTENLGARDSIDKNRDVIYGDDGLLYFLSRGVPWDDSENLLGIKTLLVDDLPWNDSQLDSVSGFVAELTRPVDLLTDDLAKIADRLANVQDEIDTAIEDPNFQTFFLPGEVFHDEDLSLIFGRSELALLKAGISFVRSGIYFFSAYENGWNLAQGLGEMAWAEIAADPAHPDFIVGFNLEDYGIRYLDENLFRVIRTSERLGQAKSSLQAGFASVAAAIRFGGNEEALPGTLDWGAADSTTGDDFAEFFDALGSSVTERTTLPFSEPSTSIDLSVFFNEGSHPRP